MATVRVPFFGGSTIAAALNRCCRPATGVSGRQTNAGDTLPGGATRRACFPAAQPDAEAAGNLHQGGTVLDNDPAPVTPAPARHCAPSRAAPVGPDPGGSRSQGRGSGTRCVAVAHEARDVRSNALSSASSVHTAIRCSCARLRTSTQQRAGCCMRPGSARTGSTGIRGRGSGG